MKSTACFLLLVCTPVHRGGLHTEYFKLFSEVSILIYDNICNIHQCMLYSHFNLVLKKYTIDHFINKHKFIFYRDCNLFLMISLALGLYQNQITIYINSNLYILYVC